jgi:hypothetical protein
MFDPVAEHIQAMKDMTKTWAYSELVEEQLINYSKEAESDKNHALCKLYGGLSVIAE